MALSDWFFKIFIIFKPIRIQEEMEIVGIIDFWTGWYLKCTDLVNQDGVIFSYILLITVDHRK